MLTVFEKIPDLFVDLYDLELKAWARSFKTAGPRRGILLKPVPGAPVRMSPNPELGPAMIGVTLVAEYRGTIIGAERMVIRPAEESDEEAIRRHVEEMRDVRLQ